MIAVGGLGDAVRVSDLAGELAAAVSSANT